jgi:1-acyl-sn-glycerol-3-phosphate acyltransferase
MPRFPLGPPTWPGGVPRPPLRRRTGVDYDTEWARRYPARLARAVIVDQVLRPIVRVLASPEVHGVDRLEQLDEAAVFAANHHSHLDTPLLLTSLPPRLRHRTVVAGAADYFFESRVRGALSALAMNAIPIERLRATRRSADLAASLLGDGWNLVIFPEGGRSPHGWGQPFRRGAAYLAIRCGRPVVPVHLEGTGRVLRKGAKRPTPSTARVTFGNPMRPRADEDARRFGERIEQTVAALADERETDWWTARRRAAAGLTPSLTGPVAGDWRRAWTLGDRSGRKRPKRSWP